MKIVNRELLIQQLESVEPGLSTKDVVEQSSCYVFDKGKVMTFNSEIACMQDCDIGITGAVPAAPMLALLRKLTEDDIEISEEESGLLIKGKNKKVSITRQSSVELPINEVERPTKWRKLPDDFLKAVNMVHHCAGHDSAQFSLTCVHITPEFVEACDNYQLTRYQIDTGVKSAILVRRDSIKHIYNLGMTELAETDTWMHFKNETGMVLSCRRYEDEYQDYNELLNFEGAPIILPKGLGASADKAGIFTEDSEDGHITIELMKGKVRIKGSGNFGRYRETKPIKYDGEEFAFTIAPQLIMEITSKHSKAKITTGRLKVDMGPAQYVSCLSQPDKK
jgi:DNA polymerase III sliding clamp (beta) subunit (PCNA family)